MSNEFIFPKIYLFIFQISLSLTQTELKLISRDIRGDVKTFRKKMLLLFYFSSYYFSYYYCHHNPFFYFSIYNIDIGNDNNFFEKKENSNFDILQLDLGHFGMKNEIDIKGRKNNVGTIND